MTVPEGKTIAEDGGRLVRVCPRCGARVDLDLVVSDVYEVIDQPTGVPRAVHVPEGSEAPENAVERGQHTDYDDAPYQRHYRQEHGDE